MICAIILVAIGLPVIVLCAGAFLLGYAIDN